MSPSSQRLTSNFHPFVDTDRSLRSFEVLPPKTRPFLHQQLRILLPLSSDECVRLLEFCQSATYQQISPERQSARMSKITKDSLTRSDTKSFIAVATVGIKGLRGRLLVKNVSYCREDACINHNKFVRDGQFTQAVDVIAEKQLPGHVTNCCYKQIMESYVYWTG